jgi:hypothetical protein
LRGDCAVKRHRRILGDHIGRELVIAANSRKHVAVVV